MEGSPRFCYDPNRELDGAHQLRETARSYACKWRCTKDSFTTPSACAGFNPHYDPPPPRSLVYVSFLCCVILLWWALKLCFDKLLSAIPWSATFTFITVRCSWSWHQSWIYVHLSQHEKWKRTGILNVQSTTTNITLWMNDGGEWKTTNCQSQESMYKMPRPTQWVPVQPGERIK